MRGRIKRGIIGRLNNKEREGRERRVNKKKGEDRVPFSRGKQ